MEAIPGSRNCCVWWTVVVVMMAVVNAVSKKDQSDVVQHPTALGITTEWNDGVALASLGRATSVKIDSAPLSGCQGGFGWV